MNNGDWWSYYLGKNTVAYGPNIHCREQAEQILNAHFMQAKEQFGDKHEVEFIREDKLD